MDENMVLLKTCKSKTEKFKVGRKCLPSLCESCKNISNIFCKF